MRHVRSILYAAVPAAAVWVLCGAGLGHGGTGTGVGNVTGLLLVLLAGAAYAIIIFAPISPAGPLVTGLVFLAASVWALASPSSYADLWPAGVTWADLSLPGHGTAAILAVPMIATALSTRRWETYEPPELPVFGRLGRTPGVARPAGPPVAGLETAVLRVSDPDSTVMVIDMDQTQVVRAPAPPAPDPATLVPELVRQLAPEPADETVAIPSPEAVAMADATQVIPRGPGGDRQVIKPPTPAPDKAEVEQTRVIRPPTKARDEAEAEHTQVIEPLTKTADPAEAEQTQVIKPPNGAPEPADAEKTQVIKPAAEAPDQHDKEAR